MSEGLRRDFGGAIPDFYERGMAPVMFGPAAAVTAARVAALAPTRLLETAAGTGQVTRLLAASLPAGTAITATDLAPAMLALAAERLPAGTAVDLRPADAQALPFAEAAFDLVLCQFGVMFFPDRAGAMREAARVLRPGGRFLFTTWDVREANPYARVAADLVVEATGETGVFGLAYGMTSLDEVRALAEAAGFSGFRAEAIRLDAPVPDVGLFAAGLLRGNPTAVLLRERGIEPEPLVSELERRLRGTLGAPATARLQMLSFEAVKPRN
ncbi:class I SAM-dependent methyltransferase [Methylobacterium currus]|uniref:Class I SAM-dependent methyltransferase n=1 Tax=Methylobacterium currus TaxID=2051553 RepID=A0A2R4WF50_9HYPH|nr:class I SAM-dependent methyltransferase [Methylobacterium currus]AWB20161.1 class I SAM-dependent methyltransferase [Methylobacterium currus]